MGSVDLLSRAATLQGKAIAQGTGRSDFSDEMRGHWRTLARFNRDVCGWKREWLEQLIAELKAWAAESHEAWCAVRDYLADAAEEALPIVGSEPVAASRYSFRADEIVLLSIERKKACK